MIQLPQDFKELLSLLNSNEVEYLIIGGYSVAYYGYPRATGDIDIWIGRNPQNIAKMTQAVKDFGFVISEKEINRFLKEPRILRMGVPPLRVELLNEISGVDFQECFKSRNRTVIEDIEVNFISLEHLKLNKQASGRHQDLSDLEKLP